MKKIILTSVISTVATLLIVLPIIVGAQPSSTPTGGNVDPTFNSLTINNGTNDNLTVDTNGVISNNSGAVMVSDSNGLFVNGTTGIAPVLTVTGNGSHNAKMHSDGWITGTGGFHLGGDGTYGNSNFMIFSNGDIRDNNGSVVINDGDGLDVRGPITNKSDSPLILDDDANGILLDSDTTINNDLNVWSTVQAIYGDITYHLKARRIGNYTYGKYMTATIAPNSTRDFQANKTTGTLACATDSVAVSCNFSAYNGTGGCANGTPTGGLNKNAVYPTYQYLDALSGMWTKKGACSMTLYNKTGATVCGKVEVKCWDPDGNV